MLIVVFVMLASEGAAIRAGRKMECIELLNFHFCQQMNKVEFLVCSELIVNDILKRVALGTRIVRKQMADVLVVRSAKKKIIFPDQVVINFKTLDTYRREGLRLIVITRSNRLPILWYLLLINHFSQSCFCNGVTKNLNVFGI